MLFGPRPVADRDDYSTAEDKRMPGEAVATLRFELKRVTICLAECRRWLSWRGS